MKRAYFALTFLLITRLVAMYFVPLNETTEARYGEIARKMLETGNWVTLLHDYNIPFLAKPPLSTWLSAGFMGVFGVNELAVRFPSLLLSVGILALIGYTAYVRSGCDAAMTAILVLASSFGFFVAAGTVMTDPALVFCMTLIMVAFWHAMSRESKLWGYLFFIGCGFGLLTKGPVALVLTGIPIFLWVLKRKQWEALWRRLPWISGCALMLAITLPWYLLAEQRTPGFLQYFIIGENISRFLDPHWKGDQYGFAHAYPRGMIWLFTLMGLFPWCLITFGWILGQRRRYAELWKDADGWLLYIVLWAATTPVFFMFSANIIWTYCLMMIPGFSLLFTEIWMRSGKSDVSRFFPAIASVTGFMAVVVIAAFAFYPAEVAQSQKDVIAAWQAEKPAPYSDLLFWGKRMEFSAAFYSGGRAKSTEDPKEAYKLLHNQTHDYIVVNDKGLGSLPRRVRQKFKVVGRYTNKRGVRLLLREAP
ncbi:MAG: glycosyltransferase family 39 protein [Proteobacteria bacterium]|nr:glycosyltransferase family 39 protein [Pseudomonadota bacterium]